MALSPPERRRPPRAPYAPWPRPPFRFDQAVPPIAGGLTFDRAWPGQGFDRADGASFDRAAAPGFDRTRGFSFDQSR